MNGSYEDARGRGAPTRTVSGARPDVAAATAGGVFASEHTEQHAARPQQGLAATAAVAPAADGAGATLAGEAALSGLPKAQPGLVPTSSEELQLVTRAPLPLLSLSVRFWR